MIASAPTTRRADETDQPTPLKSVSPRRQAVFLTVAAAAALVVGLIATTRGGLWLDEAQSVGIADRPLGDMFGALRKDGSPPLYYLLLHAWMKAFGSGDLAVRALSAVIALPIVPVVLVAARRTLGRTPGLLTGLVVSTSPFLYRYGTEARMYVLVALLVGLGWLAGERAWRQPSPWSYAAVAVVAGLLALTHYWTFFILIPLAVVVVRRRRLDLLAALAAGGLLFVPWLPSFAYQLTRTGAPWGEPADLGVYELAVRGFAGGPGRLGGLGLLYFALALLAVVARPVGEDVQLDLRGNRTGRVLALAVMVPLSLGLLASWASEAAFASRYAAIVLVPFALLVAWGLQFLRPKPLAPYVVYGMLVFAVWRSGHEVYGVRSQARSIANVVNEKSAPGDVVVVCPDQLAPALNRELDDHLVVRAFPTAESTEIVDWTDYEKRNVSARENGAYNALAERASSEAGSGTVWLVMQNGYRTFGRSCQQVFERLERLRPDRTRAQAAKRSAYERATLWQFPAAH